ncbi:T9SS type A sorting domain-containing protein [Pontimicrobium sp. SW4]|uniref:T9SS type A sorting domain-containing protein n=1 Tax=Pontimicrobium sp. SW4 TaxID=3153519 RepID=A0AAU7BRU8_9FLAO
MKKTLLFLTLISLFSLNINSQIDILKFSTENGTHLLTTDKMFSESFTMPSGNPYDLREVGINLDASTTGGVIKFAIYHSPSDPATLLWQSGDITITGGTEEYVSVSIPSGTISLMGDATYRIAVLGDPQGGTIAVDAYPNPTNEGVAVAIGNSNFAHHSGKTNYPTFPASMDLSGSNTINWYRAISAVVQGDELLSTNKSELTKSVKVFPNPTVNSINLELKNGLELKELKLYNYVGQLIELTSNTEINTSSLSKGIYLLDINTNKGKLTKKIIIE